MSGCGCSCFLRLALPAPRPPKVAKFLIPAHPHLLELRLQQTWTFEGGVLAGASCVFWEAEFGRPEKCAPPLLSPFTHTPRGTK
jgi:hypothetical protein